MLEKLQQMQQMGEDKMSLTDRRRALRTRQGFELGDTGEIVVSQDHFIVARRG